MTGCDQHPSREGLDAAYWRDPKEMDADEFYGDYVVIPKTDDPDGDELVIFGATIEEAREIVAAVNARRADEVLRGH